MNNSKQLLIRLGAALCAGVLIFISFQNCSKNGFNTLQNGSEESTSEDKYLGSKSSTNSGFGEIVKNSSPMVPAQMPSTGQQSVPNVSTPNVSNCLKFPENPVQIDGSFGQPVNIGVPIQNNCSSSARVTRLNLSINSGNISIFKKSDKQPAFVGTGFDLIGTINDEFVSSPVNNYGNVLVNLNYLVVVGQASITKLVPVNIHIAQPENVKSTPESGPDKMSCVPPGVNPATYAEAYQVKQTSGPNVGQWSACTVFKCASGHIFQGSACVKFEVPTECRGLGNYVWGTGAYPDCAGQFIGSIAVGQSQIVSNQKPGFTGGKFLKCIMFEQHLNYIDDLAGGPKVMTYMAPAITEDYSQTSCVQTSFKDCEPDAIIESPYSGVPYNFAIPKMKHQEVKTITGYSGSADPNSAEVKFQCWDGKIQKIW